MKIGVENEWSLSQTKYISKHKDTKLLIHPPYLKLCQIDDIQILTETSANFWHSILVRCQKDKNLPFPHNLMVIEFTWLCFISEWAFYIFHLWDFCSCRYEIPKHIKCLNKKIISLSLKHTCLWCQNSWCILAIKKHPFLEPVFISVQNGSHLVLSLLVICYLSNIRTPALHAVL